MRAQRAVFYDVEWISKLPVDAHGDSDWDRALTEHHRLGSRGAAERYARERAAESPLGVATLRPVRKASAAEAMNDDEGDYWPELGEWWASAGASEEVEP